MRYLLILFTAFIHFILPAQKVSIKGVAKGYEYKEIAVFTNSDYISNTQKQLTFSVIDSSANFFLEWNTKNIQYITLRIENYISNMYVQPNTNYEIIVLPPDSTTYSNPNIDHPITISIKLNSKTEINALTMDYEKRFDYFTSIEYLAFVERNPLEKIDSFKTSVNNYYSSVNNNYFKAYINYGLAALEAKVKASEKKLYATYLDKKPIYYDNPEYMNFFNSFYQQKLKTIAQQKGGSAILYQIDTIASFSGAKEVLKKYNYLQNDTICELVLIKGLYESYHDGSYNGNKVVYMLEQAVNESKIQEHKIIAQNILNSFSKLQKGTSAPFFELPDKNGVTHSLDEIRTNKYVYVGFFDSNCSTCIQQMKTIPAYKKEYGSKITFVSIMTSDSKADLKNFSTKYPKFDWLLLYDNSLGKLKKDYEIKTLPAYFLISPDGKFIQVPAENPDEEIDRAFFDITKPKAKYHGVGDKKNN